MIPSLHLAKKIIEEKFDEKISLASLCKKTALNEYKLKKGFKELFGVSIREYKVYLKMAHAKWMLLGTKEKISAIAYSVGYERHVSFTLEFKKRFGVSPKEYRKCYSYSKK
jgi:AraC family transcriptional activator of pyochelin receptor